MLWLDAMYKPLFDGFPKNYVTWDTETTGFSKTEDLICEIGHTVVENGEPKYFENHILNWPEHEYVDLDWLELRLRITRESMAKDGRLYSLTVPKMREYGKQPEKVLRKYHKLLTRYVSKGYAIIGHGQLLFDLPRLDALCQEFLGLSLELPEDRLIDTIAIEKAIEMERGPLPGEQPHEFMLRLCKMPSPGVKVNLDRHCAKKYRWDERYDIDMDEAHSAGFDSLLTHYLVEDHREQIKA